MEVEIIPNKLSYKVGLIGTIIEELTDEYKVRFKIYEGKTETCYIPKICVKRI